MKYVLKIEKDENGIVKNCTLFYDILSFIGRDKIKGKTLKLAKINKK